MKNCLRRLLPFFLAVVLLLPAGCGTKQQDSEVSIPDTTPKDTSLNIRSITGTLEIAPFVAEGGEASDYWVYIDQTLSEVRTADRQEAFQLQLMPGEYTIETAVYCYPREISFPFTFRKEKVVIREGETSTLRTDISADNGGALSLGFPVAYDESWADWCDRLNNRVTETANVMYKNPVLLALHQASNVQPLQNRIFLDLPATHGGGREFDAAQVRLIIDWFEREQWDSWFPPSNYSMPENVLVYYNKVKANADMFRNDIEKYRGIAEKLEKIKDETP